MRIILIDPETRKITEEVMDPRMASLFLLIGDGCSVVEMVNVRGLSGSDRLYVNQQDHLLHNSHLKQFNFKSLMHRCSGRGVIVGNDKRGNWDDVQTAVNSVKKKVGFP